MQGLSLLTDRIHYFGALACAQMTMGFGRQGHSADHHMLAPAPRQAFLMKWLWNSDNPRVGQNNEGK